jgi:hypothetical protein
MARFGKIPAVVSEIMSAVRRADSAGFNSIEVQCEKRDATIVGIAIAAAAAACPDILDDDAVSEHWEPCSHDSELIPTWFVPIRPATHENPLNVAAHYPAECVFVSVE